MPYAVVLDAKCAARDEGGAASRSPSAAAAASASQAASATSDIDPSAPITSQAAPYGTVKRQPGQLRHADDAREPIVSYDLIVWKSPPTTDLDEFHARLERFFEADDVDAFDPSQDVTAFYDELLSIHPPLESYAEEEIDIVRSPWSVTPGRSDRLVDLNMTWSSDWMATLVPDLAAKHGLMLYDPQGPDIFPPGAATAEAGSASRPSNEHRSPMPAVALIAMSLSMGAILFGLANRIGALALVGAVGATVIFGWLALLPWLDRGDRPDR